MQTSKEIRSNLNNLKYYAGKIQELIKIQLDKDFEAGQQFGIETGAGSSRFDSLGIAHTAAEWIKIYCENIEANLKNAESLDKALHMFNEEEEEALL